MIIFASFIVFSIVLFVVFERFFLEEGAKRNLKRAKHKGLLYRFFVPAMAEEPLPLIIYLHGAAERGSDNRKQLNADSLFWISDQIQKDYPSNVIIPQCPKNHSWVDIERIFPFKHYNQDLIQVNSQMKALLEIIDIFIRVHKVDASRIYLVGFSMGSSGVWDMICRWPERFAASINLAGTTDPSKAYKASLVPIRAFNGSDDEIMPYDLNASMCKAIKKLGGDCELVVFEGVGHVCTQQAYKNFGLIQWLFSQRKS